MKTDQHVSHRCELRSLAKVQPGYLSRSRVRSAPDGTHHLLQANDISIENGVRLAEAVRFHPERNPELYQVGQGDILLVSRGQDHRAHLILEELPCTLASSIFYIIHPRRDRVVPAYLAWWLNEPNVQAEIGVSSHGTAIGYVSRRTLEDLVVAVPSIATQHRIAAVAALRRKQRVLQAELDEKWQHLIQATCRQALRQTAGAT
jgi:hypothetical protein